MSYHCECEHVPVCFKDKYYGYNVHDKLIKEHEFLDNCMTKLLYWGKLIPAHSSYYANYDGNQEMITASGVM